MARYNTKYKIGQSVKVHNIPGKVTAIHIRNKHRSYEFSYLDNQNPTCYTCEECEIESVDTKPTSQIGFN